MAGKSLFDKQIDAIKQQIKSQKAERKVMKFFRLFVSNKAIENKDIEIDELIALSKAENPADLVRRAKRRSKDADLMKHLSSRTKTIIIRLSADKDIVPAPASISLPIIKNNLASLLTKEWKTSKYSSQANQWFQKAARLVKHCKDKDEVEKLLAGCLTLALREDDVKYGTVGSKNRDAIGLQSSKYNHKDIKKACENVEPSVFTKSAGDPYPSEEAFLNTMYAVGKYVLKDPRGSDDFKLTYHLKDSSFAVAISKNAVKASQVERAEASETSSESSSETSERPKRK